LRRRKNAALPTCEVDFVWLVVGRYPSRQQIILGECKDRGARRKATAPRFRSTDIANLKTVADALPSKRFNAFVLLAQALPLHGTGNRAGKNIQR